MILFWIETARSYAQLLYPEKKLELVLPIEIYMDLYMFQEKVSMLLQGMLNVFIQIDDLVITINDAF